MKKALFVIFVILILVAIIVVGKCVKTIVEFNTSYTSETEETEISEQKKEDLEFSNTLQIADFIVEIENGKALYDSDNDENEVVIYKGEPGCDFITFNFKGAVVKEISFSEGTAYYFSEGTEKINVPKAWDGMEVKQVHVTIDSEECGETEILLERGS